MSRPNRRDEINRLAMKNGAEAVREERLCGIETPLPFDIMPDPDNDRETTWFRVRRHRCGDDESISSSKTLRSSRNTNLSRLRRHRMVIGTQFGTGCELKSASELGPPKLPPDAGGLWVRIRGAPRFLPLEICLFRRVVRSGRRHGGGRPGSSRRNRAVDARAIGPAHAGPDAELQTVVEAWPTLPTAVRAGIVATVRAVTDETDRE